MTHCTTISDGLPCATSCRPGTSSLIQQGSPSAVVVRAHGSTIMPTCTKCKEFKPEGDFYAVARHLGRLRTSCKTCMSAANAKNRLSKLSHYRVKSREWARANPDKRRSRARVWRANHHEEDLLRRREDRLLGKHAARLKAQAAVKNGLLIKGPCQVCGTFENVHAHHEDYGKPLDVLWLCASHHMMFHAGTLEIEHAQ